LKYKVNQIFTSLQGEGIHMGKTANFIRLAGCNLCCNFCDTSFNTYSELSTREIMESLDETTFMTVITGGEPTLHDLTELINEIKKSFPEMIVALETNGTNETAQYEKLDWITCSPKEANDYKIHALCIPHELKYVVDENIELKNIAAGKAPIGHIWLQPDGNNMQTSFTKCVELVKQNNTLRVGIQMHKLLNFE
jgi:7-carboxy-7-deazaguanine synthase